MRRQISVVKRLQRTAVRGEVQFRSPCRRLACCSETARDESNKWQLPEQRCVQAKGHLKLHSEEYPAPWMLFSLEATLAPCDTRPALQEGKGRCRRVPAFPASPPAAETTWQLHRAPRSWRSKRNVIRFSLPARGPVWPPVVSHLGCQKHKQ